MRKVFISYRRDDSRWVAGRIYDALAARYDAANVFKDVYTIPLGVDFRDYLGTQVAQCDVMLVVIGAQWLSVTDDAGQRRLDNPADFTRVEIEQALQRAIPVIPVLVDGTRMPRADELPESLAPLAFRNATAVRDADFPADMGRLFASVEATSATSPPLPPAREQQGRALGGSSRARATSSSPRWRSGVLICLGGSAPVLALLVPWLAFDYPNEGELARGLVLAVTAAAGVTFYTSLCLLRRPSPQRQGLGRLLLPIPQLGGTCALLVASIVAGGVAMFGLIVFGNPDWSEMVGIVGILLSLVGALVALFGLFAPRPGPRNTAPAPGDRVR